MTIPVNIFESSGLPVAPGELRSQLRETSTDELLLMELYLATATESLKEYLETAIMFGRYELRLDDFPRRDWRTLIPGPVEISYPPLIEVESVEYRDSEGVWVTWDAANYETVNDKPSLLTVSPTSKLWPATYRGHDAVKVTFTAGYLTPVIFSADTVTCTDRAYADGDTVQFSVSGSRNSFIDSDTLTLPTALSGDTTYYVVNASGNTFQIALTEGGAPVTFVADQQGTTYEGKLPKLLRLAIIHLASKWYAERCDETTKQTPRSPSGSSPQVSWSFEAGNRLLNMLRWKVGINGNVYS